MLSTYQLLQVGQRWTSQWEWFHHPIHVVAHILHPLWHHPLGNISLELQDGCTSYSSIHCHDHLDENALDDELLIFLRKEEPFAQEATNLQDPLLAFISWWEKFGRHVTKLQALALRALSQDCSSLVCERNWSCFNLVQTKKQNMLNFLPNP
jgi:hypothetical protein